MDQSDRTLIQRWQREADADAFGELVRRHAQMVFAAADRILRNTADAEEVVQESFLSVGQLRRIRGESLGGLLHTIATHLALNRLKAESRRREREIAYATNVQPETGPDWSAIARNVDEAIASLPDAQRNAVVRHFLGAQSYRVIAEDLGRDESTVRHHAQRGLIQIRSFLQRRGITAGVSALTAGLSADAQGGVLSRTLVSALGKQALAGHAVSGGLSATAALGFGGIAIMTKKLAVGFGVAAVLAASVMGWRIAENVETSEIDRTTAQSDSERADALSATQTVSEPVTESVDPDSIPEQSSNIDSTGDAPSQPLGTEAEQAFAALLTNALMNAADLADGDGLPDPIHSSDIPEDNGMHFFLKAWELLEDPMATDMDVWEDVYRRLAAGEPLTDEEWANYTEMHDALDLLRHGIDVGNIAMPIGMDGPNTNLPFLAIWRRIARITRLDAEYNVSRGDYVAAIDDYQTIIQFGDELGRGGPLINGLVGVAVSHIGTSSLIEFMTEGQMSADEYRAVIASLDDVQANALPHWETLMNEQAYTMNWFEDVGGSGETVRSLIFAGEDEGASSQIMAVALRSIPDEQLVRYFNQYRDDYDRLLQYSALPYYEALPLIEDFDGFTPNVISNAIMPSMARTMAAYTLRDTRLQGAITVAAVEAYRVESGAYPNSLDALVPDYLSNPAIDPFTGDSLRYQPRPNGYRLYSVGTDMQDNGGTWDDYKEPGSDVVFSN